MNDPAANVSKKLPRKVTESAAKPAKARATGRLKRPATAKGLVTQRRRVPKDELELEPITPFARGASLRTKLGVFTITVVVLFMALQGALTYSIAERQLDAQIMEQGRAMATTLEKSVDRSIWLEGPHAETAEALVADWELRLRQLKASSENLLKISLLEVGESSSLGDTQVVATWPREDLAYTQDLIDEQKDEDGQPVLRVYEGRLGDGQRIRCFLRRVNLDLEREDRITSALRELDKAGEPGDEDAPPDAAAKRAEALEVLHKLTGAKELQTLEEWLNWREEHPRPTPREEWTQLRGGRPPWVSLIVKASRLDELKQGLWQRIGSVTLIGGLAGVILLGLISTLLTAPIRTMEQDLAEVAKGDLTRQTRVKTKDEIGALAHVFNIMLRNLRIAQENAVERQAFERELNIAKEIQEKLLPERIPQIPGIDIHSHYQAAKEVGGDYYDFIVIDQTHLGIIVADVAGKGIPGAMVMTMARSLVRLASVRNVSPADTFKKVNRILAKDIRRGMFVTAAYMVLNVKTRQLKVASAGHNPVLLYRAASGELELLKPAGIALGFDKGTIFDNHVQELEVQLEPGDRIVTYTDGVNEAMNNNSEEFGDARFHDLVKEHATKTSQDFVAAIVAALAKHRGNADQSDDITITTLAVQPGSAPTGSAGTTGSGGTAE